MAIFTKTLANLNVGWQTNNVLPDSMTNSYFLNVDIFRARPEHNPRICQFIRGIALSLTMNILPKKRWHVRNKDNIARVRRDEAKAEEEKNEKEGRLKLAEREARTNLLRERARLYTKYEEHKSEPQEESGSSANINFFQELEFGHEESNRTNKEHEKEKKEETEKYEKQIGYLTYLGQDTNEALGKKNWYDEAPNRDAEVSDEVYLKSKIKDDPLEIMKKFLPSSNYGRKKSKETEELINNLKTPQKSTKPKSRKKDKKRKRKSRRKSESDNESSGDSDMEQKRRKLEELRRERLQREKEEACKADFLLAAMRNKESGCTKSINRKYNSQFNPELARQNFS